LFLVFPFCVFSQQGAAGLRDYVGVINQSYHPGVVSIFEKIKEDFQKQGDTDGVKAVDIFLSGAFGSGFLYSDAGGNIYVITNNHVVDQSYTLSITFESADGTKRKYENLKIIAVDEEKDLAILAFPDGEKPSGRGLTFLDRAVEEGDDVYSAGFPGLGITPIWQFGRGMVSNSSVRFPKSIDDETLMGPFIQHTAQVDAGNSGGPLLIAWSGVQGGYAVVGVNTLSGTYRQAANYAVPANVILEFINRALNQKPDTFRAELDARLEKFIEGLKGNSAVYPHIAEFLSSACIGENADFAVDELNRNGTNTAKRAFNEKCRESIVGAMGYAVAWTIETEMRSRGAINAEIKQVEGSGDEYTVVFTISNREINSVWVREYGNWRIKTFGTSATGDPSRVEQGQKERAEAKRRAAVENSIVRISASFVYDFDLGPMFGVDFRLSLKNVSFGSQLFFGANNFLQVEGILGFNIPINAGNVVFNPFIDIGVGMKFKDTFRHYRELMNSNTYLNNGQPALFSLIEFGISLKAGLMFRPVATSGFFMQAAFQYSLYFGFAGFLDKNAMLIFGVGYAF